jgi:hypothetical protein
MIVSRRIEGVEIHGDIIIRQEGRPVGRRVRDKIRVAWLVLTGQCKSLGPPMSIRIEGCTIHGHINQKTEN